IGDLHGHLGGHRAADGHARGERLAVQELHADPEEIAVATVLDDARDVGGREALGEDGAALKALLFLRVLREEELQCDAGLRGPLVRDPDRAARAADAEQALDLEAPGDELADAIDDELPAVGRAAPPVTWPLRMAPWTQ